MTNQQPRYPRVARFRSTPDLRAHLATLQSPIPLDDAVLSAAEGSPLAAAITLGHRRAGNRWCIHPMEGWDATDDGRPTDILLRRWQRFGESGAKLIWGGEAVAVVPEGRANPNQLCGPVCGRKGFESLLSTLREAHRSRHGSTDDLIVALQLTHSGRFSKPTAAGRQPQIAYHHPLLDSRHGIDPADASCLLSDDDVERLIESLRGRGPRCRGGRLRHGRSQGLPRLSRPRVSLGAPPAGTVWRRFCRPNAAAPSRSSSGSARPARACSIGVRLSLFDTVPWHKVGDHGEPWPYADGAPLRLRLRGRSNEDPTARSIWHEPIQLLDNPSAIWASPP
jgi:NADPH2 dehydrogenase